MTRPSVSASVLLLALIAGCASGPSAGTAAPGTAAPDFAAVDTDGNPVSLAAYRNTVLILDFWAVW